MTDTALTTPLVPLGEAFLAALTARDFTALRGTLAPDVRMRLLVPRGPQENSGAEAVLGRFTGWFAGVDELCVLSTRLAMVAGRLAVEYQFRVRDDAGWRLIEQHLFVDAAPDGGIAAIDLLCSGFRADPTG